jgi:predicted aspartyl protease
MATGFLDSNGDPHIKLTVRGAIAPSGIEIDFLIDTGYQGFVLIPILQAFPIGLILAGTTNIVMANGQPQPRLTCIGSVECDGEEHLDLILIEPTGQVALLGMEFLRAFHKRLSIDPMAGTVELISLPLDPPSVPTDASAPQC